MTQTPQFRAKDRRRRGIYYGEHAESLLDRFLQRASGSAIFRRHSTPPTPPPSRPVSRHKPQQPWVSLSQPSLMRQPGSLRLTSIEEEEGDGRSLHPVQVMLTAPSKVDDHRLIQSQPSPNNLDQMKLFEEKDIVVDENGRILAGSLRALIRRLIPRKDYYPDRSFIFSFLLNARIYIAPADLLHQVLQQCLFEQNAAAENFKRDSRTRFFSNVLRLCREWTETFPYDFRHPGMMERLRELLSLCASSDSSLQLHSKTLLQNLLNKLSKLERYETALENIKNEVSHKIWPSEALSGVSCVCSSPTLVAQQLTHIELERLSMIDPEEFVFALSKDLLTTRENGFVSTLPGTKNLQHYVDWFNRLTYLVATDVSKHLKKKHRVKIIEFYIGVAKECINIGNFNSLMAIVAGLNMTPISRLKKTWVKVETSKLEILQHQLDPSANFTSYRSTLKAAVWRSEGAKNDSEKIVVPFFSLFVKDLLIVHHKCARRLPNGHLDFAMFAQFAAQMRGFLAWKTVSCPFQRKSDLLQYILTDPVFTDKALQLASFECEPPELNCEKEQHKQLKLELQWSR